MFSYKILLFSSVKHCKLNPTTQFFHSPTNIIGGSSVCIYYSYNFKHVWLRILRSSFTYTAAISKVLLKERRYGQGLANLKNNFIQAFQYSLPNMLSYRERVMGQGLWRHPAIGVMLLIELKLLFM